MILEQTKGLAQSKYLNECMPFWYANRHDYWPHSKATHHNLFDSVAVHLGVKMADTLSFNAKVDMVDF